MGNKYLAMSYFHMVNTTLSSALSSFTSEFEMDSGGTYSLSLPDISGLGVSATCSSISTSIKLALNKLSVYFVLSSRHIIIAIKGFLTQPKSLGLYG